MRNIRSLYGRLVPRALTWSVCVKADAKLVGLLLRVVPLVFGQLTPSLVKVTWGYAKNVRRIYRASGPKGLAIFLKTCYLLLQHAAGGMKDASPKALGANVSRTRRGIPRILNPQHRSLVLKGDVRIIGFWLTLFGLYRVVEFKGSLKLSTITAPGIDISGFREDWNKWVPDFYSRLRLITKDELKLSPSKHLDPKSIPFIRKCSPSSGGFSSVMALPWDIALFGAVPEMRSALVGWLKLVDGLDLLWALNSIWKAQDVVCDLAWESYKKDRESGKNGDCPLFLRWDAEVKTIEDRRLWHYQNYWGNKSSFGSLGFKEEPGKIRVFAMVSLLTQTLMQPLHKWIFEKLRLIPTDGTFDQAAPVARLIKRFKGEEEFVASYDLSAATDRLPLLLQMDLLEPLLGRELTALWAYLLVGRPYRLPKIAKSYNLGFTSVSYAVGQPMGALSSWAMLALTHHALVQYAASKAEPGRSGWFMRYAVLGDDVVIADRAVSVEYLRVMKTIGVEVSLAKSLISCTSSLEFAKRTWVRGREVTPISLMEALVSLRNVGALEQLVLKLGKFGEIRLAAVARFAGFGYRNLARLPIGLGLGNRLSGLIAYLCRPGGMWSMPVEAWLCSVAPGGNDNKILDTAAWKVSGQLWSRIVRGLLNQMVGNSRLLYDLSTHRLTDTTFLQKVKPRLGATAGRTGAKKERVPFFSTGSVEFFDFERNSVLYNEFFTEWVMYPLAKRIRSAFEKIDDILRVLSPHLQPTWSTLEETWRSVFEAEDGVNSLPSTLEVALRENEELPTSTRLITLWRTLRRSATREGRPSFDLRRGFVPEPKARRRRRGS